MATRLQVNDPVVVYLDLNCTIKGIGFVRYIGFIKKYGMKQHIGIELIEPIQEGHNGTIDGTQYFDVNQGYGILVPIRNIIKN